MKAAAKFFCPGGRFSPEFRVREIEGVFPERRFRFWTGNIII